MELTGHKSHLFNLREDTNIYLVNYSQGPKLSLLLGKDIRHFNLKFLSNKISNRKRERNRD